MHITNILSRIFGRFAETKFPKPIQSYINNKYVSMFNIDMSEFLSPDRYDSLVELFTRKFEKERIYSESDDIFISPVDGLITDVGDIHDSVALQIKGMTYSVKELLGFNTSIISGLDSGEDILQRLEGGIYINFYLSPSDYHRYHMPYSAKVIQAYHIPGKLYPVNLRFLNRKYNLFVQNERVVIKFEVFNEKIFYLVLVGALNVGKMVVNFEPSIETNSGASIETYIYKNLYLNKGDEFGYFKMGSTVVLLAENSLIQPIIEPMQKIRFGDSIAKVNR